jgi:hypothetical protein
MYIDCNDKKQRQAVFAFVRFTVDVTEKNHQAGATIHLDYLRKIEAVIERLEEIVEEQEERIAIMSDGGQHEMP